MRADATHRYEFDVDGGRRTFECLARTRAEAEKIAGHAGAPTRLRARVRLGDDEGDAVARRHLQGRGLLDNAWRDDLILLVDVLDRARCIERAVTAIWVGSAPPEETALLVQTMEDGSWSLHLREQSKRTGPLTKIDWERCPDAHCRGLGAKRPPLTSVWSIALEGLAALTASIGLRPGALSADPIDLVLPERA